MQLAQVNITENYAPAKIAEFQTLGGFVSSFLPKVLILAGVIFFFLVVFAGVGVIAGAGSSDAHAKEKSKSCSNRLCNYFCILLDRTTYQLYDIQFIRRTC